MSFQSCCCCYLSAYCQQTSIGGGSGSGRTTTVQKNRLMMINKCNCRAISFGLRAAHVRFVEGFATVCCRCPTDKNDCPSPPLSWDEMANAMQWRHNQFKILLALYVFGGYQIRYVPPRLYLRYQFFLCHRLKKSLNKQQKIETLALKSRAGYFNVDTLVTAITRLIY